jgi:hypothetical protein
MKKFLLTLLAFLLLTSYFAYAKPPTFNPRDLTVTLECVRVKQGETIGDKCYKIKTQYSKGLFNILSISQPFEAQIENTDQTFDLETYILNIPYIEVGSKDFYINLKFNASTGKLSIEGYGESAIHIEDSEPDVYGTCLLDTSYATVCYNFKYGVSRTITQYCSTVGGTYSTDPCPQGSVMTCKNVNIEDSLTFDIEHYGTIMNQSQSTSMQIYDSECTDLGGTIEHH